MSACILVTGASSGIGEATVLRLVRAGRLVAAGVRDPEDGARLAATAGPRLRAVTLDVTDEDSVATAIEEVAGWTGGTLAGVVNNAGIAVGGPLEYLPLDDWRAQMEVNVIGAVSVTRAALPLLRQGSGRIVMIGSNSGRIAIGMMGPYCASKHALEAVAESLRLELRPWGIPVALIEPGATRTRIWEKGRKTAALLESSLPAVAVERYRDQIDEVAAAIESQERAGIDPDRVAAVVEHALTSPRPRPRYQVGVDARISALLDRFVPDRARPALVARLTSL